MKTWRIFVGVVHRFAYATVFTLVAWHACTWPLESPQERAVARALCYVTNFPTAVVGRITAPYRGMDVFFDRGGEWCDFCSEQQVLVYHLRFAVPVYVLLFYLPKLAVSLARKARRRSKRENEQSIVESPNRA